MGLIWFNSETPVTKFAPNLKIPLYKSSEGSDDLYQKLTDQLLTCEKQIATESLVSEVPKNDKDPYQWTQHWKQHSIFWDKPVKGGDHFERFVMSPELEKLFHIIRKHSGNLYVLLSFLYFKLRGLKFAILNFSNRL